MIVRKLLKKQGITPAKIVTDKLRSYASALSKLGVVRRLDTGRWRNNRTENSHQPLRQRERQMKRFKSPASAQRFLSTHAAIYNVSNIQRHLISRRTLRLFRDGAMLTVSSGDNRGMSPAHLISLVCDLPINVTVPVGSQI